MLHHTSQFPKKHLKITVITVFYDFYDITHHGKVSSPCSFAIEGNALFEAVSPSSHFQKPFSGF